MVECTGCKRAIRGESGIRCNGVCGKLFHDKCSGLDKSALAAIESSKLLRFICEDCMQYIHNIDYVLRDVQAEVARSNKCLDHYKDEFSNALKTNELELKCLLEAIESRFNDRIDTLKKAEENCLIYNDRSDEMMSGIKEVVENTKQIMLKSAATSHNNVKVVPNSTANSDVLSYAATARAFNKKDRLPTSNSAANTITTLPSLRTPEWTTVTTNKKKKHSLIGAGAKGSIGVVSKFKWLHVSSFKNTVSEQDVIGFLSSSTKISANNFQCFKLVKKDADISKLKFINFKLGIEPTYYAEILNPAHWPANVRYRPFEFVKRKQDPPTDESGPSDGTEHSANSASVSSPGAFLDPTVVVGAPSPPDHNAN